MTTKTRRQKVAEHMTGAGRTPEELAVAQAWLAENGTPLERIAEQIKVEWGKGIDSQFAIGRLLIKAREQFTGNVEYGRWVREQNFPFSKTTAYLLKEAAGREDEVRAFIGQPTNAGRNLGVTTAIEYLLMPKADPRAKSAEAIPVTDSTPADPAYAALRNAYNVILKVEDGEPTANLFKTMHVDDLAKSAGFIKALAAAYTEAKEGRTSK